MDQHFPQSITMEALLLEKIINIKQKNFYCVFRGREVGIFTTWAACEQRVDGYSHASFKGYSTLPAAIEAMRQAGISEPIIFHRNLDSPQATLTPMYIITKGVSTMKSIDFNHCQSTIPKSLSIDFDTSLNDTCIEATYSKTVTPSCISESSSDVIDDLNTSISETEISFSSNPRNIFTGTESQYSLPSESFDNIRDKSTMTEEAKSINTHCSHESNDEILSLIKKLSITQQELALKQQQELVQIKEQNLSLQKEIDTLKEQNLSVVNKLDQAHAYMQESHLCWEKARNDLVDSTLQTKSIHLTIQQLDQNIKHLNKVTNESSSHNLVEQNKQASIRLSNLQKENAHLQKENEELRSQINTMKIDMPATETINVMKKDKWTQIQPSSVPSNKRHEESCTNTELHKFNGHVNHLRAAKSDTSVNDSDSEFESIPPLPHQSQKPKENVIKPNYLKVPQTCKNLLLGDSNMKNVQRKRFDRSGQTEIRTFRGASIKTLDNIIQKCSYEYPQVQKVSICIGTIDCTRNPIDKEQMMEDYDRLITTTRKIFPNASICILSIPPQSIPKANKFICTFNNQLYTLARRHNIHYSSCSSLWNHVESDGKIENGVLYDRVHLTDRGLSYLLTNVSRFFFRQDTFATSNQHNTDHNLYDVSAYPPLKARDAPWNQRDTDPVVDTYAMKLKTSTPRTRVPPPYSAAIATKWKVASSVPGFASFETFV